MSEQNVGSDGYEGSAEIVAGARTIPVTVRLAGHVDPVSGRYQWYGRVAASPDVTALVDAGTRTVILRTPAGQADTPLRDVDMWGRYRVEGFSAPPFPVATDLTVTTELTVTTDLTVATDLPVTTDPSGPASG